MDFKRETEHASNCYCLNVPLNGDSGTTYLAEVSLKNVNTHNEKTACFVRKNIS